MTRFPELSVEGLSRFADLGTPRELLRAFDSWFNQELESNGPPPLYPGEDFETSNFFDNYMFAKRLPDPHHPGPLCLLDYIGVWLHEGPGASYAETYEMWLLGVIAIIDDWHRGTLPGAKITALLPSGECYDPQMQIAYWGDSRIPDAETANDSDPPLRGRFDEEGLSHPALRKEVFDAARRRALIQEEMYHRDTYLKEQKEILRRQGAEESTN